MDGAGCTGMTSGERSVVVTGVSTGIGWEIAKTLCQKGFRVYGSVRKEEDAAKAQKDFGEAFTPLLFDVRDDKAIQLAAAQVRRDLAGRTLFGLVNNSGIGKTFPVLDGTVEQFQEILDVNLLGVFRVCKAFIPLLGSDRTLSGDPGRIIQISSMLGRIGCPLASCYSASKHGLEGFSESLRRELMLYGIDVIIVGPGIVVTPIWDMVDDCGDANSDYAPARKVMCDRLLKPKGDPPIRVARVVYEALTRRNPPVRIACVHNYVLNWVLPLILPARLVDWLVAADGGLRRLPRLKKEE